MAAPESTKFQVNYKLSDGTLVNLYAKDVTDLETGLADLGMVSALIKSTAADLGGSAGNVAYAVQALGATPVAQPAAAAPAVLPPGGDAAPECRHGVMSFRSGVGQKGPWKGWMCAAPKGAVDKCDTVWVR